MVTNEISLYNTLFGDPSPWLIFYVIAGLLESGAELSFQFGRCEYYIGY
jgi:hypothetical protein